MRYLLLPFILVALLHLYLWRRLVRDLALPRPLHWLATSLLCALCVSGPLALTLTWIVSRTGQSALKAFGFGWLGIALYLTALLVIGDIVRFVRARPWRRFMRRAEPAPQPSASGSDAGGSRDPAPLAEPRRVFIARAVAGSAVLASGAIGVLGVRSAVWDIVTPEVPVTLARLPRALDGYSIALLSDIHIGPMLDGRFLRDLVERTNRLRPDLIAITGDLVDGYVHEIGSQVAELRGLRARDGVFFVTGNHEYYSRAGAWVAFLERLGVRVLMNETVAIGDRDPRGAQFDLAGIPDRGAGAYRIGPDAMAATRGRDPERELVMLAHQPIQILDCAPAGAGLQLSGHTHGGQLLPFGALTLLRQPYLAGLHRHAPQGTQIYVTCGAGFWGPPMRVLAPAEIALIRLQSA